MIITKTHWIEFGNDHEFLIQFIYYTPNFFPAANLIENYESTLRNYKISNELYNLSVNAVHELHRCFKPEQNQISSQVFSAEQTRVVEQFIAITSELLQMRNTLCSNCAFSFISFSDKMLRSRRKNNLHGRMESLQKEALEYRELLRRIEIRLQESHAPTDDTLKQVEISESQPESSPLVPAVKNVPEKALLSYPFDSPEIATAYDSLVQEEAQLEEEILAIFAERQNLLEEASLLEAEAKVVEEGEILVQRAAIDLQAIVTDLARAQEYLRVRTRDAYSALHQLAAASPVTDLFPIELDGAIPTISSFPLGRTPADPVDWVEISSALGQVALLLDTLRRRNNFSIPKLQILPRGAASHIVRVSANKNVVLNLFRGEKSRTGLLAKQSPFDLGMEALLEVLECIVNHYVSSDSQLKDGWATIDLTKYTIGGYSVKYSQEKEVEWTCAMRCLLFNCKKILFSAIHKKSE